MSQGLHFLNEGLLKDYAGTLYGPIDLIRIYKAVDVI